MRLRRGGGPLVFAEAVRDGTAGVTGIEDPAAIAISPDGAQLYVAGSGANAVAIFARDGDTGALRPSGVVRDHARGVDGLDQPGDIAISPDGANVYVAGFDDDALAVFARNPDDGKLRFLSVMRDRVGGVRGLGGAVSVVVSPDGRSVYVAGRQDDSLAVFARDAKSGAALRGAPAREGLRPDRARDRARRATPLRVGLRCLRARDLCARLREPPDPAHRDRARRGSSTHALTNAASVAVSPDGANVVAASYGEDALELFARDPDTGELQRLATAHAGVDAPARMRKPLGVTFAPSGREVYAASASPGRSPRSTSSGGGLRRVAVHRTRAARRSPRRAPSRCRPTASTSTGGLRPQRDRAVRRSKSSPRGARDRAHLDPAARRHPAGRAAVAAGGRRRARCPRWSSTSRTASGSGRASATRRCTTGSRGTGYAALRIDLRGSGES